jgi:hypothetical protein
MTFMAVLLQFVTFDVLAPEPAYLTLLGEDETQPLTENFNFAGYSSS